ncbi:MAG: hypothetical protein GC137_10740 [Alphaproteobacteria bacterium]|nr:hypothetical protein [Alphaproteobacteria bacterium]
MAQSNKQMALLKNRLQMPMIVRDLLVTQLEPADDATYGLHEMMGNFRPEEALLCAALVMEEVAFFEREIDADMKFLKMECARIIERYSARDDLAQDNPELWAETEADMLPVLADDLEEFLEIIFMCYLNFELVNPNVTAILDILTAQLQSHSMIVDEVLLLHEDIAKEAPPTQQPYIGNIVSFPK